MIELKLYGTSACHLCELAEDMLAEVLAEKPDWRIELIDIADNDAMMERYGVRIPVLSRVVDGRELDWPFEADAVVNFVERD